MSTWKINSEYFLILLFLYSIYLIYQLFFFVYSAFYPFYSLINIDKHISPRDQELRRRTRNAAFEAVGIGKALKADVIGMGAARSIKIARSKKLVKVHLIV